MVHEVVFGKWRNHQERLTRAIAATAGRVVRPLETRERRSCRTAHAGRSESIRRALRVIQDWAHLVVIPAVGIVIQNDNCSVAPIRLTLEEVNGLNDEGLLVQRDR